MTDYPKALYTGTKKKRKLATAKNANHERQLRSQGYVDYAELPDDAPNTQNGGGAVSAECAKLAENWNSVEALTARLNEIQLTPAQVDYSSWTVKQLQAELTRRGISFSSGTNKAQLIELLKTTLISSPPPEEES